MQLEDGPLDLTVSHRGAATRSGRPDKPRLSSDTLTSASLARLMKQFGTTTTTSTTMTTVSLSGASTLDARVVPDTSSMQPPAVTVTPLAGLFNPSLTPDKLSVSSEPHAAKFSSLPPPSRWRRDSFWANGGWLAVPSSSVDRKRQTPAATSDSSSKHRRSTTVDVQSIKLNRKQLSNHTRKSSCRTAKRSHCDGKLSPSDRPSSSQAAVETQPLRTSRTSTTSCADSTAAAQRKDLASTSPRTDSDRDVVEDTEKKQLRDDVGGDVVRTTTTPVRCTLTSLRCGGCGAQFESLYSLTVHLEETGHSPASDVTVLPTPPPTASPDRRPPVASPGVSCPPTSAPQRLVRGQDVWLAHGVEQTDRILRCIQCNAPARSLAELTLHMVHTRHYINIVGPTASTTSHDDQRQRPPPTTPRDKPADTVMVKARNGLRIATTSKDHHHGPANAVTRRDGYVNMGSRVFGDDHGVPRPASIVLQSSADVQECNTDQNANERRTSVLDGPPTVAMKSVVPDKTTQRGSSSFSVRNLIASDTVDDRSGAAVRSSAAVTPPPCSQWRNDSRSVTSSVGPEVTSSGVVARRTPVNSRLATVSEHDVISA